VAVLIKFKKPPSEPDLSKAQFVAEEEFKAQAYNAVLAFAMKHNGEFATEHVRFANPWLKSDTVDGRFWGIIMRRVEKDGYIERVGVIRAISSNKNYKVAWRRRIK
jgi:hypothetical protein